MLKIITDSSANISQEEAKKLNLKVIPLTVIFGNEEFQDGINLDCDAFYQKMATSKDFPHTAQLTEEQIDCAVKEALEEADEVLIMPIASVLSGTYERCKSVAARYENVYAYDTHCTTVMLKLFILEALKIADKGAKAVMEMLDALRPKLKIYAALDTLENLKKGGRLSGAAAFIGTMLKIKPVITFAVDGRVEVISKQFGINKGMSYLVQTIDKNKIDFTKPVYLIYTGDDKNSEALISRLNIPYTEKLNICPVIGTHIGRAAAGVVFAEK
ncbi:MAG: DegV family protein [Clostridia bacterium]|jgi:DegV family protein with EDD domain|nr:DegV family protein [Clostridia bacterium]